MHVFIVVFMFLFPFVIYPWGEDPYYTVIKFFFLAFVGAVLLPLVLWKLIIKGDVKRLTAAEWLALGYLGLIVVSTIFSKDIKLSIIGESARYEGLISLSAYVILFLFTIRFVDWHRYADIYRAAVVASFFVAIYGVLQHFLLDFLPRSSTKIDYTRSYSFFDNPNFFGAYLTLMLPLAMTLYLNTRKKWEMFFYFVTAGILFLTLLYTLTRSGWLGSFVAFLFLTFFVVMKKRVLWKKWISLSLAFALIFITVNVTEDFQYISRANSVVDDISEGDLGRAGSSRGYIWSHAIQLIPRYFWIGSGPDTFALVFPHDDEDYDRYLNKPIVDKAHNEYLQIAVTMGVPALTVYLLFLFVVMRRNWKSIPQFRDPDVQIYACGLLATVTGYLVQAFFNISVITVTPFFWIILAMTYGMAVWSAERERSDRQLSV
ncbi:MAG: O-antigen ligase family protein [Bacillaceae bacterium]|nr:O-antigen ligase family protein [Bacillaceae bacterium]